MLILMRQNIFKLRIYSRQMDLHAGMQHSPAENYWKKVKQILRPLSDPYIKPMRAYTKLFKPFITQI